MLTTLQPDSWSAHPATSRPLLRDRSGDDPVPLLRELEGRFPASFAGTTTLFGTLEVIAATHDPDAFGYADRILVLNEGRLLPGAHP